MDKHLRILRLSPYYYFDNNSSDLWDLCYEPIGGMQVQITEQTKAISKICNKQVVLTIGLPKIPRYFKAFSNTDVISVRLLQPKIKSESKGMVGLLGSWALGTILWSIKLRFEKKHTNFDIIHFHSSDLLTTFINAPFVARILKIPLVITIHCSPTFTFHPSTFLEKLFHPFSQLVEKWAVKKADFVYVLTEKAKEKYINSNLVSEKKLSVISDGVNVDAFKNVKNEDVERFRTMFNLPENKFIISYIGRIAPEKGWHVLVNAANILKGQNIHFLICGDGHSKEKFKQLVTHLGLREIFTFTGFIPHKFVPLAMKLSNCVVLPSLHEELGGTILEVIASMTPLVASRVGGIPYIIDDGVNGFLFPPGDTEELAKKLYFIITNKKKVKEVCENALKTVETGFSIDSVAKKLVSNYKYVILNNINNGKI